MVACIMSVINIHLIQLLQLSLCGSCTCLNLLMMSFPFRACRFCHMNIHRFSVLSRYSIFMKSINEIVSMATNYITRDIVMGNIPLTFSTSPPLSTTWNVISSILLFFSNAYYQYWYLMAEDSHWELRNKKINLSRYGHINLHSFLSTKKELLASYRWRGVFISIPVGYLTVSQWESLVRTLLSLWASGSAPTLPLSLTHPKALPF